jgi:hypothetical protein
LLRFFIRCNENEIIVVAVPNNARVFNAFFGLTWIG